MNYSSFGDLVKQLREKKHLTQLQLSKLTGYSEKQLRRIEQNINMPSINLLHSLSKVYNLDLNHFYKISFNNLSIEAYNQYNTLNNALFNNDLKLVHSLVKEFEILPHFKYGENLQLILYSKAICSSLIDFDYETSINYCIKGIQIDYPNFSIEKIKNYNFSNVSYAIINCLCCNYLALNKTSTALKIYLNLVKNIKSFFLELSYPLYRSTEYICKLYQVSLYNISDIYIEQGEYENALLYANIGINFSIDKNIFRFLPDLYFIKFKSNYYLENYIEAKKMYEYTRMLYSISKNPLKAENLEKRLKSEFVKLT